MKHAKTIATSVAVVVATSAAAMAMNVGILQATTESDVGADGAEWSAEPTFLTLEAGALPSNAPSTTDTTAAVERSAPAPTAAPASAPTAAPATAAPSTAAPSTAAPTAAPSSAAPAESSTTAAAQSIPSTTYHTYTVGNAGEVTIANHGSSLEFWSAYPTSGWEYGVEKDAGREVKLKFRGNGEIEWKAILVNGSIKIESAAGGDDDDDEDDEDDD